MAKTRKNGHRRSGFTIPVAAVAGFLPLVGNVMPLFSQGAEPVGWMLTQALTGYDTRTKAFWVGNLYKGTIPIAVGMLAHKIIGGKLGVNRMLAAARIPIIRI